MTVAPPICKAYPPAMVVHVVTNSDAKNNARKLKTPSFLDITAVKAECPQLNGRKKDNIKARIKNTAQMNGV